MKMAVPKALLECSSSSHRFPPLIHTAMGKGQSGSFAAAVQSASRIFVYHGKPQDQGNRWRNPFWVGALRMADTPPHRYRQLGSGRRKDL
jgi:hypothetical protein